MLIAKRGDFPPNKVHFPSQRPFLFLGSIGSSTPAFCEDMKVPERTMAQRQRQEEWAALQAWRALLPACRVRLTRHYRVHCS